MSKKIEVELNEIIRTYRMMEKLNNFFHQSMNFVNTNEFAEKNYEEIRTVFYKVIWNWIPPEVQEQLMEE